MENKIQSTPVFWVPIRDKKNPLYGLGLQQVINKLRQDPDMISYIDQPAQCLKEVAATTRAHIKGSPLAVKLPDEGYYAGNNFITKADFLKLIETVPDDFIFVQTITPAQDATYLSVSIHPTAFGDQNTVSVLWTPEDWI